MVSHYQSKKSKGTHTTNIDTSWCKKFIKKCNNEPTITGINLSIIEKGGSKNRPYKAKKINTGIEVTVFGNSQHQIIFLKTDNPKLTANNLEIDLVENS